MAENMMNSDHKDNSNYRDVYDDIEWVDYSKEKDDDEQMEDNTKDETTEHDETRRNT